MRLNLVEPFLQKKSIHELVKKSIHFIFIFLLFISQSHSIITEDEQISSKNSTRINSHFHVQDTTLKHLQIFQYPDTIHSQFIKAEKDTNFSYKKYMDFLEKLSDTTKFIVVPIDQFSKTIDRKKIIIGLRHDVDLDLDIAFKLSMVENNIGFRSSYYILHTAPYYLADKNNMAVHNDLIIPTLQTMQNEFNHEIGWHNDLVTLQLVYKIDPVSYFHGELNWLRKNGLNINGTASHGSSYCYTYKYLNYYFFQECMHPKVGKFVNNDTVWIDNTMINLKHSRLRDFKLEYEAYFLNNNKYFSDAQFINHERWHPGNLDVSTLVPGDRVIILTHPIYYWPSGSNMANLNSFEIQGQLRSDINYHNSSIQIEIPEGERVDRLHANFVTSTNASVWIGRRRIRSDDTPINFTQAVKIRVIAEDGLTNQEWTVTIKFIETKFTVYPNPSTGIVSLQFDNIIYSDSELEVYNALGTLVYSEKINQKGSFTLLHNFTNLPAGIYYLRLLSGNKLMIQRFVRN